MSATEKCSLVDTCSGLIAFVGTSSLFGQERIDNHLGNGFIGLYAMVLSMPILRMTR